MTSQNTGPDTGSDHPVKDTVEAARETVSQVYHTAVDKAGEAAEVTRERAHDVAQQTAQTIDTNPLAVVVGGLALGAIVAAVLPRSEREKQLLAPVGKRIGLTAAAAFAAAKAAGRDELETRGLTAGNAKDGARSLFDNVVKAASTAGTAAVRAGKDVQSGSATQVPATVSAVSGEAASNG